MSQIILYISHSMIAYIYWVLTLLLTARPSHIYPVGYVKPFFLFFQIHIVVYTLHPQGHNFKNMKLKKITIETFDNLNSISMEIQIISLNTLRINIRKKKKNESNHNIFFVNLIRVERGFEFWTLKGEHTISIELKNFWHDIKLKKGTWLRNLEIKILGVSNLSKSITPPLYGDHVSS